jgi:hypothetical protein
MKPFDLTDDVRIEKERTSAVHDKINHTPPLDILYCTFYTIVALLPYHFVTVRFLFSFKNLLSFFEGFTRVFANPLNP